MITYEREELVAVFNVMASFLAMIRESGFTQEQLFIASERMVLERTYSNYLKSLFTRTPSGFIRGLRIMLKDVSGEEKARRACIAYVVSLWLDKHFTYNSSGKNKISLTPLVPLGSGKQVEIGHLNSNFRSTGIWINPKFLKNRKITNRAAWMGINCDLINVAYCVWDGTRNVKNIIFSGTDLITRSKKSVVAFAPLTANEKMIDVDIFDGFVYGGMKCKGGKPKLKTDMPELLNRIEADLISVSKRGTEILFMPEMLGTKELCGKNDNNIAFIRQASIRAAADGLKFPSIIILPSFWDKGSNSATIVSSVGKVLGVQEKYVPFAYFKDEWIEALKEKKIKEMLIIHIPNKESISVIICSAYLKDFTDNWSDVLCRSLGVNHIIVPSYSFGEDAFIKMLSHFRTTGTSISWGNCCGANKSRIKKIGGHLIAELDEVDFYKTCMCDKENCKAKSCVFIETVNFLSDDKKKANKKAVQKGKIQKHSIKHIVNNKVINEDELNR